MWHFSNSFRPSSKYQHLTIMTSFPSLLVGNQRSRLSFPVWLGTIRLSRHYPCALFSAFIFLTSFGCNFIHYIMTLFSVFSVSSGLLPHVILAVQYWVFDFESCSFLFLPSLSLWTYGDLTTPVIFNLAQACVQSRNLGSQFCRSFEVYPWFNGMVCNSLYSMETVWMCQCLCCSVDP